MFAVARLALLCLAIAIGAVPAIGAEAIGVVLLHGKTGGPGQLDKLAKALTGAGYAVDVPEMCWSRKRIFDKAFPDCMAELGAAFDRLKAKGASKFVVGGASQGAVAALAFGATRPDLAGIIALAPAADPVDTTKFPAFAGSIKSARALAASGQGDRVAEFADMISGAEDVTVKATPKAFLSFHGPDSPIATMRALMTMSLPNLKVPLLWVAGTKDPASGNAPASFAKVPMNRLNRYVTVDANHAQTPDVANSEVLAWLATLH